MSRPALEIFFTDLQQSCAVLETIEVGCPRLSTADDERAERRAAAGFAQEARWWRAARIALRLALERSGGPELRGLAFDSGAGGRPELPGGRPSFSVSHSGSGVLIAIAQDQQVGADVEAARSVKMSAERRRRLIEAEQRLCGSVAHGARPKDDDAAVLGAWVRLEALAKYDGSGIGRLLTAAGVVGGGAQRRGADGALSAGDGGAGAGTVGSVSVRHVPLPAPFVGAVAARILPEKLVVVPLPMRHADLAAFLAGEL